MTAKSELKFMHLTERMENGKLQPVDIAPEAIERLYEVDYDDDALYPPVKNGCWIRFKSGCTIRVTETRKQVEKSYHAASSVDLGGHS